MRHVYLIDKEQNIAADHFNGRRRRGVFASWLESSCWWRAPDRQTGNFFSFVLFFIFNLDSYPNNMTWYNIYDVIWFCWYLNTSRNAIKERNNPTKQQNEEDEEGEQQRGPCQPRLVSGERTSRPTLLVQAFVEGNFGSEGGRGSVAEGREGEREGFGGCAKK